MPRKAESPHVKIPKGWPTPPFVMRDATSPIGTTFIVVERTVGGWRALGSAYAVYSYLNDYTFMDRQCALESRPGKRFTPWHVDLDRKERGEPATYKDHLAAYKLFALRDGATPEAIRLLDIFEPLTEKEVSAMAAAKEAKDAPKKAAPAKTAAGKGGAAAKPKADKAPAETKADARKITVLKKDNPYREGSARAASFDALKGAKTVDEYKAAGGAVKYISRWEAEGIIKLS